MDRQIHGSSQRYVHLLDYLQYMSGEMFLLPCLFSQVCLQYYRQHTSQRFNKPSAKVSFLHGSYVFA